MRDGLETMSGDEAQSRPSSVGRREMAPGPKTTRGEYDDEFLGELLDEEPAETEAADSEWDSDAVAAPEPGVDADRITEGGVEVVMPGVAAVVAGSVVVAVVVVLVLARR